MTESVRTVGHRGDSSAAVARAAAGSAGAVPVAGGALLPRRTRRPQPPPGDRGDPRGPGRAGRVWVAGKHPRAAQCCTGPSCANGVGPSCWSRTCRRGCCVQRPSALRPRPACSARSDRGRAGARDLQPAGHPREPGARGIGPGLGARQGNAAAAAGLLGEVGRGAARDPGATVRAMMRRLGLVPTATRRRPEQRRAGCAVRAWARPRHGLSVRLGWHGA